MNQKKSAVFIGHFSPGSETLHVAASPAGNQVQRQILKEFKSKFSQFEIICYSMAPMPAWPRGKLIHRSKTEENIKFIGFINIQIIKHIIFAIRFLIKCLSNPPLLCLQYNSYLFENLALLIIKKINNDIEISIIIQDIWVVKNAPFFSKVGIRSLFEKTSLSLAKKFDLIFPISEEIIKDFKLSPSKSFLFQGGVTEFAKTLITKIPYPSLKVGVFAGALEPYNGIDLLVKEWIRQKIPYCLHVFGRGSLSALVADAANASKYVKYHGFQPENVIIDLQSKAYWNFCFRFSNGLEQKYFFPSKIFNILAAPGSVIVNDFYGLTSPLRNHVTIIRDDFSNLLSALVSAEKIICIDAVHFRRNFLLANHNWETLINKLMLIKNIV